MSTGVDWDDVKAKRAKVARAAYEVRRWRAARDEAKERLKDAEVDLRQADQELNRALWPPEADDPQA